MSMPTTRGAAPARPEDLGVRSEEMQDIIEQVPAGLVRWGISALVLILGLVLAGTYLIKYPDVLTAPFVLTTQNAPKVLLARSEGRLMRLLVRENQLVREGQHLAYLESTAAPEQVLTLERWVQRALATPRAAAPVAELPPPQPPVLPQLGELQPAFQAFDAQQLQFAAYTRGGFFPAKRALLVVELANLRRLHQQLQGQRALHERDQALSYADLQAQRQLYAQRVIAPLDLKREESRHLAKQLTRRQVEVSLINNLAAQSAKQKEVLELDQQAREQHEAYAQGLATLRSAIEAWKARYLLIAPSAGFVHFEGFPQERQPVRLGQEILYIAPPHAQEFGEIRIPQYNFGKVRAGQRVLVRFDSYPAQEFGTVPGTIAFISEVPAKDGTFRARVALPAGLTTTFRRSIVYKPGMRATADIITADVRLLAKIFHQFRKSTRR